MFRLRALTPRNRRTAACVLLAAGSATASLNVPAASAAIPSRCNERADGGSMVGYGLTADQRFVCFKVSRPQVQSTLMSTRELVAPDVMLVGIDVRPASGVVYGLGNAGGLYVLDPSMSKPEFKARMNVALDGANVGLDFNPTVDRLRIVTDSGQNLRVNVDTGATTVDSFVRSGANRVVGVGGVAYTNNDSDASTATTLYDLDSVGDQLVTQNPPNDGVLVPVGGLGFRGSSVSAFDIMTTTKDGKAVENAAFAVLDGGSVLFRIDLATGRAHFAGHVGTPLIGLTFGA